MEYWQENWETLMERVENGETIGVENDNGEKAVMVPADDEIIRLYTCLLYTSPSPRDGLLSRMPSSA